MCVACETVCLCLSGLNNLLNDTNNIIDDDDFLLQRVKTIIITTITVMVLSLSLHLIRHDGSLLSYESTNIVTLTLGGFSSLLLLRLPD